MEGRRQAGVRRGVIFLLYCFLAYPYLVNNLSADEPSKEEPLNLFARRGDINDFAGMLSETERHELEVMLESVKKDASTELVIVTIPSYKPAESLRQYAQALMQAWEVGKERRGRGVMFILTREEKEVWVAAQPEVRAVLTEDICNAILRDAVLLSLRKGVYGRGLLDGIIQIRDALRRDKEEETEKKKGEEKMHRLALIREWSKRPLELITIRFLNTTREGKPLSAPAETFPASKIRFVAWEAVFRNRLHGLLSAYHRVEATYYSPKSQLLGSVQDSKEVSADAAEVTFTARLGNSMGEAFLPGTYRVDFYVDGRPFTSRKFQVEDDR